MNVEVSLSYLILSKKGTSFSDLEANFVHPEEQKNENQQKGDKERKTPTKRERF